MGATLPILARHAVREDRHIGSRIGLLYGANTAGAAAGALSAAFLFLPWLGLGLTVWIAVGLNAAVFRPSPWCSSEKLPTELSTRSSRSSQSIQRRPSLSIRLPRGDGSCPSSWFRESSPSAGKCCGTRLLSHLLGGSIYAFGLMLATFLVGIAVGSTVASRWADSPERARVGFCVQPAGHCHHLPRSFS